MFKVFSVLALLAVSPLAAQMPPSQPESGPGGREYVHGKCKRSGPFGRGAQAYHLFEPASPRPASAPVVVFLHGYLGVDPASCLGWIEHLVRRGHTVIFPVYQKGPGHPQAYTADALIAVQAGLERLGGQSGRVRPEPGKFALAGYSLGATIAANLAGLAAEEGLPAPKVLFLAHAGNANTINPDIPGILRPPANIPDLLLLGVVGQDDDFVGDTTGVEIVDGAVGVTLENRNLIRLASDSHGRPVLLADHSAPLAAKPGARKGEVPDALDFHGYWKWLDALLAAAFDGTDRETALGDTDEQRFMGLWSDGTPVTEPTVETY